jgi:hypothetical protein
MIMVARRLSLLAMLLATPSLVTAQRCVGSDNSAGNNSRVMTFGGRVDIQDNANSYGGTFGIVNGMSGKPMYYRAHLRVISFPGSTGTGFGFTLGKALVSTKTTDWCLFGSLEQVSVSGGSSGNYELGAAYGNTTDVGGDLKFVMFIRGGALMSVGGGTTSTDPFAEVGFGPQLKNGLSVNVSYVGVFSDFAYDFYRVHVTYPFNILKR